MTSFVLIDYENVQPRNVSWLNGGRYRIKVFIGSNQRMEKARQALGSDIDYVQITGNGKNALDFHVAYYIGRLAVERPDAAFHIISADAGFDPLVNHLTAQKISCRRWKSIVQIPPPKGMQPDSVENRLHLIIADLVKRKNARPRRVRTLRNTIKARLQEPLGDEELDRLVLQLAKAGVIEIVDQKVQYKLSA